MSAVYEVAERHDVAALRAFHALDGAFSRWSGQPRDELQGFADLLCRQPRIGRQRTQHRFPSFRRDSGPSVATVLVTAAIGGQGAVKVLLRRLVLLRVGFRWYVLMSESRPPSGWIGAPHEST